MESPFLAGELLPLEISFLPVQDGTVRVRRPGPGMGGPQTPCHRTLYRPTVGVHVGTSGILGTLFHIVWTLFKL